MRKVTLAIGVLGTLLVAALCTAPAYALSERTWVSNTGSGVACTETAPCATFAAALAVTAAGGEIDCLSAGDYGAGTTLVISQSVSINCGDFVGGITAPSGSPAISVAGSSTTVVNLKSLVLNGNGVGTDGIDITNANTLNLQNVTIQGFTNRGVDDASTSVTTLVLYSSFVIQNGGPGVVMAGASGSGFLMQNSTSAQNKYGVAIASGNGVDLLNSVVGGNTTAGIELDSGAGAILDGSSVQVNAIGIEGSGTTMNNSTLNGNGTAISGTSYSYGNNRFIGNGSAGTTPIRINLD